MGTWAWSMDSAGQTGLLLEASRSRQLSGSLEFSGGEFYNGVRWNAISRLRWQPNPRFLLELALGRFATLCERRLTEG